MEKSQVAADYTTVVNAEGKYVEVSDSFCELVGYSREELIGKPYSELTVPDTTDIQAIFSIFLREGYMQGLWMLLHRNGSHILIRYESWIRPDCFIESRMELVKRDLEKSA